MGDTMWKQCAEWMCSLEVLPPSHRILCDEADATTLAYTLRDGVLLCHIANALTPGCIDTRSINQRPQLAQFLCLKNIHLFLNVCSTTFGLKDGDFFEASMLYDFTDFAKVLHTLAKLSQSPKARLSKPNVQPFPHSTVTCFSNDVYDGGNGGDIDEEDHIYKRLEDMHSEDRYKEFYLRHQVATVRQRSHYYMSEDHEEKVYADLCDIRRRGSGLSQTHQELRSQLLSKFELREKRDHCIKELIETEGNYNDALNMLRQNFIKPMTSIKETDKKIIFMNIIELGEVHAAFFSSLLESISGKTSARRIGEIFVEFKERFLKYGEYCSSLQLAQETLDSLCAKNEAVQSEVDFCEKLTDNGRFRLRDLLAVPMQRILKYHLILKELLNRTPATHDEYRSTQQAYETMIDVSEFINEVKRDSESIAVIRETQASITDWNMPQGVELKDYGRLKRDGELRVHSHDAGAGKNPKPRYLFIFDKVLLICKAVRGDHYRFIESLKLSEYNVEDVTTPQVSNSILSTPSFLLAAGSGGTLGRRVMRRDSSRWTHSFLLAHTKNQNAYTLSARTVEDKAKWIEALRDALDNVTPRQGQNSPHQIVLSSFSQPTSCDGCRKLLKGIFFQGYRCHVCSRSMHKDCISKISNCWKSSVPPALPPRPPSMQLPTPATLNRISSFSVDDSKGSSPPSKTNSVDLLPPSLPKCFPFSQQLSFLGSIQNGSNPDYVNTRLEDQTWFVGEMERDPAVLKLTPYPIYSFLVRCRVVKGEKVGYALSLKTDPDVKHMKIEMVPASANVSMDDGEGDENDLRGSPEPMSGCMYFLSESRKFRSIVELVTFYSRNSLKECFSGLDTTLKFPIGELTLVRALHDFSPNKEEKNMLSMQQGDQMTIIDKCGDQTGWWKAFDGKKIGYIPKSYVAQI